MYHHIYIHIKILSIFYLVRASLLDIGMSHVAAA